MPTVVPPAGIDHGEYAKNAAQIKSVVNVPVIAVGRINDIRIAESILRSGGADICTMARASLADPDMPNKVLNGKEEEVLHCIGCMQGCIGENGKGNCVRCLVNPLTGMEDEYDLSSAKEPKNVLVAGGGVAGAEAAIVAAKRGHHVTLVEQSDRLGGQWIMAAVPPNKAEFTNLIVWQNRMLKKYGVDVRLNTKADRALVKNLSPDVIIDAIGSNASVPPVPGLKEYTVTAREVLSWEGASVGHKVLVIGGGLVGAETADYLAVQGHEVSVVEMRPEIMADGEATPTTLLLERYQKYGVDVYTSAKVCSIGSDYVTFERDGKEETVSGLDTIINAMGSRSDTSFRESLEGLDTEIISVGDAKQAKNGYLGIREGFEAGLSI